MGDEITTDGTAAGQDLGGSLLTAYDALLLDLDGTVYRGGELVPGAAEAVAAAHRAGVAVRYVTNNASRGPEVVSDQLTSLGIPAKPVEVTTSAQAAAGVLAQRLELGSTVLVVGTDALADEVAERGLVPVREAGPDVKAVVQGLSQDAGWRELAEATLAIRAGALWVACNIDPTLPTERGQLPGNGALVAAVRTATNAEPVVAGKPARPLMDDAIAAAGGRKPLVIGDRLDTDIAGAHAVGVDSLVVFSGVSTPADLLAAPESERPQYLATDLGEIVRPLDELRIAPRPGWTVGKTADGLTLTANADADTHDAHDALRALCAFWWAENAPGDGPNDPPNGGGRIDRGTASHEASPAGTRTDSGTGSGSIDAPAASHHASLGGGTDAGPTTPDSGHAGPTGGPAASHHAGHASLSDGPSVPDSGHAVPTGGPIQVAANGEPAQAALTQLRLI